MSAARPATFSRIGAFLLVAGGAALFFAMLWLIGAGADFGGDRGRGQAHAASVGLNGYAGLTRLIEAQGYAVTLSRNPEGHRTRDLLVKQRTQLVNMIRSLLAEFGIEMARGLRHALDRLVRGNDGARCRHGERAGFHGGVRVREIARQRDHGDARAGDGELDRGAHHGGALLRGADQLRVHGALDEQPVRVRLLEVAAADLGTRDLGGDGHVLDVGLPGGEPRGDLGQPGRPLLGGAHRVGDLEQLATPREIVPGQVGDRGRWLLSIPTALDRPATHQPTNSLGEHPFGQPLQLMCSLHLFR